MKLKEILEEIKDYFSYKFLKIILIQIILFTSLLMLFIDDFDWFKGIAILQSICFLFYIFLAKNHNGIILSKFKKEINFRAKEDSKYKEINDLLSVIENKEE